MTRENHTSRLPDPSAPFARLTVSAVVLPHVPPKRAKLASQVEAAELATPATRPPPPSPSENPLDAWSQAGPKLLPAAWSPRGQDMPAARIKQGSLELLQWVALFAMVIDHLGYLGPAIWGAEPVWMRFVGRISYPLFALVLGWRLAHMTWRNPRHDFIGMGFKLCLCALGAQVAWGLTGAEAPINPVVGFTAALFIIVLLQEDRSGLFQEVPLAVRWLICTFIGFWVHQSVDYGMTGLLLTLSVYAWARYNDKASIGVALASVVVLSITFPIAQFAFMAVPLAMIVLKAGWKVGKPVRNLFYWFYPLHILALALLVMWVQRSAG